MFSLNGLGLPGLWTTGRKTELWNLNADGHLVVVVILIGTYEVPSRSMVPRGRHSYVRTSESFIGRKFLALGRNCHQGNHTH